MLKKALYHILEPTSRKHRFREPFEIFLMIVILINTISVVLQTVQVIFETYRQFFIAFELLVIAFFTVEYAIRIWVCTLSPKFQHPLWGRLKFIISGYGLIDLIAILPFYLPLFITVNSTSTRIFQLLRLLRVFKLERYVGDLNFFFQIIKEKKQPLKISLYSIAIVILLTSSILYFLENPYQPYTFSSIPASLWWGIVTFATIGYGDMIPMTLLGKIFAGITGLLGIALFAIPAGILSSSIIHHHYLTNSYKQKSVCPHCRKKI